MSLLKKPTMTEKRIAASQRNAKLSRGPLTREGKERIGAAQFRHGLYVRPPDGALQSLGEDPDEFAVLLEGLRQEFNATGELSGRLVLRLARLLWVMERSDRGQEGESLRRAKAAEIGRDNRQHARMMRLKMTLETLRSLARSVAAWHYVTTRDDLEVMKRLHQEGVMAEMGGIALDLFYQLQAPGTDEEGVSEEEKARRVVNSVRSIFGIGPLQKNVEMLTPAGERMLVHAHPPGTTDGAPDQEEGEEWEKDDRYPNITEEDWLARERARKLLRNILTRQAEACEAQRKALLRELLDGPSAYELAAETAPNLSQALLVRRTQDANMREVRRLTNLLLKMQGRKRRKRAEADAPSLSMAPVDTPPPQAANDPDGEVALCSEFPEITPVSRDVIEDKDS